MREKTAKQRMSPPAVALSTNAETLAKVVAATTAPAAQLGQLELELQAEYRHLALRYIEARLVRVNTMLDRINAQLHVLNEKEKLWLQIYHYEIELIRALQTNTETAIAEGGGASPDGASAVKGAFTLAQYTAELEKLLQSIQSPLVLESNFNDAARDLPFAEEFDKVLQPFRDELSLYQKRFEYQCELTKFNLQSRATTLWRQFDAQMRAKRQLMVDAVYARLAELYQEYYGINGQQQRQWAEQAYYRSVVSPQSLKRGACQANDNTDNYYHQREKYCKKNKIELTAIRQKVLGSVPTVTQLADQVSSLDGALADADLTLMREGISRQREAVDSGVMYAQDVYGFEEDVEDDDDDEDEDEEDDDDDDDYDSDDDDEEIVLVRFYDGRGISSKYKQLLQIDNGSDTELLSPTSSMTFGSPTSPGAKFKYQELPPLEAFPILDGERAKHKEEEVQEESQPEKQDPREEERRVRAEVGEIQPPILPLQSRPDEKEMAQKQTATAEQKTQAWAQVPLQVALQAAQAAPLVLMPLQPFLPLQQEQLRPQFHRLPYPPPHMFAPNMRPEEEDRMFRKAPFEGGYALAPYMAPQAGVFAPRNSKLATHAFYGPVAGQQPPLPLPQVVAQWPQQQQQQQQ